MKMNRDQFGRHAIYINVLKGMLMYIACLCPNLVIFMQSLYTLLNFLFTFSIDKS